MFYFLENVAYKATVASYLDTLRYNGPENAVDENTGTSAVTNSGKNPSLSVRLSEYLNISRISVYLDISTFVTLHHNTRLLPVLFIHSFIHYRATHLSCYNTKVCNKLSAIYWTTGYYMNNVHWQWAISHSPITCKPWQGLPWLYIIFVSFVNISPI